MSPSTTTQENSQSQWLSFLAEQTAQPVRPAQIHRSIDTPLVETHDEWAVAERRYLSEESMAKLGEPAVTVEEQPLAITA